MTFSFLRYLSTSSIKSNYLQHQAVNLSQTDTSRRRLFQNHRGYRLWRKDLACFNENSLADPDSGVGRFTNDVQAKADRGGTMLSDG